MGMEGVSSELGIIETDGLHTFSGLVDGRDYIISDSGKRYIEYVFPVEDYPVELPVFRRVSDRIFEVPINAIPMNIFTFTEDKIEDNYIGSYEIFDILARIFSKLGKQGYKFQNLNLSSIALCPGERKWLQFIPSKVSLVIGDQKIDDYSELLDDLEKYDSQNDHEKLKNFFKFQYLKYLNEY